ncbi:MAG TPA: hypothetical protein VFP09_03930, partial [Desertimonas sp.]|nr:hypothetical protein [Desertimonas sp.]
MHSADLHGFDKRSPRLGRGDLLMIDFPLGRCAAVMAALPDRPDRSTTMYARRHVSTANRNRVEPTFPPRPHRWRTVVAALAAAGAVFAGASHADAGEYGRPQITISASAQGLAVPSEVPGGLVDITLETEADEAAGAENVGHHLVIARLNDGVTLEEAMAAGDAAFMTMMTVKGGNGTIAAGESLEMTLDLQPGNYFVLDNPQLPDPVIETFVVVEPTGAAPAPEAEGTVHIGPNMVISVPENFDGTGVWHFVNDDPASSAARRS